MDAILNTVNRVQADNVVTTQFYFTTNDNNTEIKGYSENGVTSFSGVSRDNSIIKILTGEQYQDIVQLLLRAVNNRTIERNYFKLYSELLEGTITDDEFEKEIEENEDNYVISNDVTPLKQDVAYALKLSKKILDVKTTEDISSLFSFNSLKLDKLIIENE